MSKAENIVVGIYGHKGSGKTTTAVLFTKLESEFGDRKNFFSNLKIDIPKFKWLRGNDMIELTDKLNDSVVLVDELHEYADCRTSNSFQNKRVADFFLQSRHTKSNVYYTTQFKDQVDKRIQRITDIDMISENLFIDSDGDGDNDLFHVIVVDRRKGFKDTREFTFYAKPIFDIFDSTERINPFVFTDNDTQKWMEDLKK